MGLLQASRRPSRRLQAFRQTRRVWPQTIRPITITSVWRTCSRRIRGIARQSFERALALGGPEVPVGGRSPAAPERRSGPPPSRQLGNQIWQTFVRLNG